eukprot:TRINITY_DN98_c0_g1_i1.p3 TRINITY_DN98_c0_g1~~TRINITY_DN98_c0_g1_i1.p3  ORF type:complete len:172 (+),score=102.19 TRINITY_DN98_c0_g1_i1:53-517(+)
MANIDMDTETYNLFAKGQPGIAPADVGSALRCRFKAPTEAEAANFPKGPVDQGKFASLMGSVPKTLQQEEVSAAFQVFDKVANGLVSSNEVRGELTKLADDGLVELSDEDIDEMMAMMDPEKTGSIAYDEFVGLMMGVEKFEGLPPLNPDDVMI